MRRRDCLTLGALSLAACAAPSVPTAIPGRALQRIGVQLYTVRDEMMKDTVATLAAVAQAGYAEVETAGTGTLRPFEFAAALKNVGLTAPAAHVPINLVAEEPQSLLEVAQTVGYKYLVVPWLPPEMRTLEGYGDVADALNGFGEMCAEAGVKACYHNHDFEFQAVDGIVPFDFLLKQTDPSLVHFELDLFWVTHAGADGAAYLAAQPQRYPLCHVKDRDAAGEMVDVGDGEIDFARLFSVGTGLQHYFVEHDQPAESMASIRRSIAALKALRY